MTLRILFAAVLITAILSATAGANYIAPKKAGTECRLIGADGRFTYHRVDSKSPTEWHAEGSGFVRLFVRGYSEKQADFQLFIDGKEYKKYSIAEKTSAKYKIEVGKAKPADVTMAKVIRIKLPKGKHTVEMRTEGQLFARMVGVPKKPSVIAPEQYEKSLPLLTGDVKTTYYSGSVKKPVVFKFNGSGTLTVWSRLAFSEGMKGKQHYTIVAQTPDGKQFRTKLSTSISSTSTWEGDGKVIPSKAKTLTIPLSKGENRISLWAEETAAPYCAFRFSVKR